MTLSARMPELAAMDTFLAVARHGSFGAAARELGLTQQAVSARIAALEAQVGVRLVARTPRGSELTEAGRVASQWSDRLLQVAGEVDAALASLRETSRSRVKVSASLTIAEQLLPGWLVSLRVTTQRRGGTAPDIVLTATNSEHVVDNVRRGTADVGFVEGPRPPRGLRSRVVGHDELVLVVRPDHVWARRSRPLQIAELARTPLVAREEGSGTREFLDVALRERVGVTFVPTAPALELSTAAAVRAAVLAGAGPAVVSRLAVAADLASGQLCAVAVADLDLRRELRAIWPGGRTPPAGGVRDLLSHIGSLRDRR